MNTEPGPLTLSEVEIGMESILRSPSDRGVLRMIVRRPGVGVREVLPEGELDLHNGLIGDNWKERGSRSTPDGSANMDMQLNVMNARVIDLLTRHNAARWSVPGDQLLVDLDLSRDNLPPGTRLALGSEAVIEVTAQPHTGCSKFAARFGEEALRWVNSPVGKELRLRGLCAKVVKRGRIRVGSIVSKL